MKRFISDNGSARVRFGEVEGQRGQRVHHAEVAHVLAVEGFHAQDADDDLGRHAVFTFGACQRVGMLLPEAHPGADAYRFDEAGTVGLPVFRRALRGRQHQAWHLRQKARLAV